MILAIETEKKGEKRVKEEETHTQNFRRQRRCEVLG